MFAKILVANRGEIACRVMRTARRLGVRTVAVYSEADAGAMHVAMADEAVAIGGSAARESYLDGARIIEAARRTGAAAVHPGYGFLSENAGFAEACGAAGLVFIGPPAAAIRAMGSKAEAKALMATAGVPLVPGYHGEEQGGAALRQEAARIGFPLLIKASAGGGGRGMRVVAAEEEFEAALASARREAEAAFGDGRVLLEKYLLGPRHIEVQVFGDAFGRVVSLHERDCSVQRRHQKVVEEAPAPGMSAGLRARMGEAACAAARAVGYQGAGTVEFIVPGRHVGASVPGRHVGASVPGRHVGTSVPGQVGASAAAALAAETPFYFMEMNTRLQVEHPVTEMVTGLDLVEWQLRVAAGEALPETVPGISGHAIEVRICAEDPGRGFLPATGVIGILREPEALPGVVRVESGVREGDAVTPFYDSMLAKLVVWGKDRGEALRRMQSALDDYAVVGVATNLDLLRRVMADEAFGAGGVDTGFIGARPALLAAADAEPTRAAARVVAALHEWARRRGAASAGWAAADGWRLGQRAGFDVMLREEGGAVVTLRVGVVGEAALVDEEAARFEAGRLAWRGRVVPAAALRQDGSVSVLLGGVVHRFELVDPLAPPPRAAAMGERVAAPIPGRVIQVSVAVGDAVSKGDLLLVIEAMKMEIPLRAPAAGVVMALRAAVGGMVEAGVELVDLGPAGD